MCFLDCKYKCICNFRETICQDFGVFFMISNGNSSQINCMFTDPESIKY